MPSSLLRPKPTDEDLAKPVGMLDLHEESGLAAIRECGVYDAFLPLTGECAESNIVADQDGNLLWADQGELSLRPEISRNALHRLLVSNLPPESIQWSHKLVSATSITVSGHTETELDFGAHGKHTFDLVIGADGAWSKVRNVLTDVKPRYSGIQNINVTIRHITSKYPKLAELVGAGTFMALGTKHGVMSQRTSQDSARIYFVLSTADEHFATVFGLEGKSAEQAKDILLNHDALLKPWGSIIKELVAVACDEESADNPGTAADIKPLYMLPVGHTWENRPGVTLIGDASHLMCPWAGEGVNLAMWDSLLLSRAIIQAYEGAEGESRSFQSALDPLVKAFEVDMWARAKEKADETVANCELMFGGDDSAKAMADMFKSFMSPQGSGL
ncbi:salicylate hydroxylase [Eremomyces bilateralis CBS 781.70]|uniref:Salicylate hydroxylase n=1 Tax=Eremomyces bilateralis CBS 781.70 TaxID=1392243 RepID=A0A6G1GE06_9PEZI|nr:salicylate hydroxylase [Eremomyces bilateralis CBS 781.70]KAF1816273.1 salicylate hydroxylase [Eremomyces bilateralis CBS 781.70]